MLLNLALLWLFATEFGFWYLGSSIAAYLLAMGYNFLLQRGWTFKAHSGSVASQAIQFFCANVLGLTLNTIILFALVERLGFWYMSAQAVASLLVAVQSFLLYQAIFQKSITASTP